ncbi:MAG: hypothetical protein WCC08_20425, partial [Terrimicrobiaceae bacterium]
MRVCPASCAFPTDASRSQSRKLVRESRLRGPGAAVLPTACVSEDLAARATTPSNPSPDIATSTQSTLLVSICDPKLASSVTVFTIEDK